MPKISVIIPVYKVEEYLNRCVDSILNQTFQDFELILVDDGSPDNCGNICDGYALKDTRVKVIHKQNGGLSDARNTGIDWVFANSDSEWITFVDSDDWIHVRMLEVMLAANLNNQTEICMGLLSAKYEDGSENAYISDVAEIKSPEDAWCDFRGTVSACCKLYDKKLFTDIRFPVGKLHEDTYTTYKVVFKAMSISVISSVFYFCYNNPNSITRSAWHPKRLDVIGAHNEQRLFFKKKGLKKAYISSCNEALTYYSIMLNEMDQKKYPKEAKLLRKEIRRVIKQNKEILNLSLSKNSFYYESSYPVAMKFYWYYISIKNKLLKMWFHIYDEVVLLRLKLMYPTRIMNSTKTIKYILKNNCSIARYGDGEFELMMQTGFVLFQDTDEKLAKALTNVFINKNDDLLICFPYPIESMKGLKKLDFWRSWALKNKKNVVVYIRSIMGDMNKYKFGDACISRPYTTNSSRKKTNELFFYLKQLWQDKDILFVEGQETRLGVGNDLFDGAKSIKRILAPAKNAFDKYNDILESVLSHWNGELVIIALGPTATVLACDLSKQGIQALDIGHIDIQYEWFLKGDAWVPIEHKYTAESVGGLNPTDIKDNTYISQIIDRIN